MPIRLPSSSRAALLTYEPYYGLKEKPFSLSVDPRFLYKSRSHAQVFEDLLAGIRRREGLIVLTGDIGTGKTTLCRAMLEKLDRKTFSTFVPDPFVSREDLLKMLLIDFGVMSVDDLKTGRLSGASRPDLSYPLYEFLNSLVPLQAFAVLILDEAQNLSLSLLEEIRILSDLEAPEKLLQVVLVGQLELRAKLKLPEMRQVDQRVSVRCNLEALDREAVAGYIAHRLAVAGGGTDRVAFSVEAVELIFQTSKGVPRPINLICDRALHRGHVAQTAKIDADIVRMAVADLGLANTHLPAFFASEFDITLPPLGDEDRLLPEDPAIPSKSPDTPVASTHKLEAGTAVPTTEDERVPTLSVESQGRNWNRAPLVPHLRRWQRTRRLAVGLSLLLLVAGAIVGVASWQSQRDALTAPIALPRLPPVPVIEAHVASRSRPTANAVPLNRDQQAAPAAPSTTVASGGAGVFAIDVALFNGGWRADRLVSELTAAGYHAYQNDVDLGNRGHLHEVLVGIYRTREAADVDAARIREIPGYRDAKVVAGPITRLTPVTILP